MKQLEQLKQQFREDTERLAFSSKAANYWQRTLEKQADKLLETKSKINELESKSDGSVSA